MKSNIHSPNNTHAREKWIYRTLAQGMMIDLYRKHYAALNFERSGLFELVERTFHRREVLYPGCFVHITSSLYFPHVVYVDRHPEAQRFFTDAESVTQFVERNKHYRRSAYVVFIAQDFNNSLDLQVGSFDVLISIYAAGAVAACKRYLGLGGLVLTNDHQEAKGDDLELMAAICFQGGKYRLIEGDQASRLAEGHKSRGGSSDLRQGDGGLKYVEDNIYFLFKKRRSNN